MKQLNIYLARVFFFFSHASRVTRGMSRLVRHLVSVQPEMSHYVLAGWKWNFVDIYASPAVNPADFHWCYYVPVYIFYLWKQIYWLHCYIAVSLTKDFNHFPDLLTLFSSGIKSEYCHMLSFLLMMFQYVSAIVRFQPTTQKSLDTM